MATCNTEYFIGNGKVFIAPRTAAGAISGAYAELGDCEKLMVETSQNFTDIYESCSGSNSIAAHVVTQTDWKFSVDALSFSKANLARALNGTPSAVTGTTVTGEALAPVNAAGDILFTRHPNVSSVVVKQGATTLVLGTAYTLDAASGQITILTTVGLTGGAPYSLTVDYTYATYDKVASNTTTNQEYAFKFIGVNKVTGKQVVVEVHRVALNLAKTVEFLGNNKQVFTLDGMCLPDANGAVGDSQFVTIRKSL